MDTNERKSEAAQEQEAEMEQHEAARLEAEQNEQQDLNQGMQTGTHDARHPGIKWGPSYKVRRSGNPKSRI